MNASQFSNPRKSAIIDGWPSGRMRVQAKFEVEGDPKKGERVSRTTQTKDLTGWNAPHRTTYSNQFVIVDGDDGKTYLLGDVGGGIVIWAADMKHTVEYVWASDPRYPEFLPLFKTA